MTTVYPTGQSHALLNPHRRMLEAGSTPDVIAERGTFSARRGRDVPQDHGWLPKKPGIVFRVHTLDGGILYRLRLNNPGRLPRYMQPKGRPNRLDVHPRQHERIKRPGSMRYITEGEKKVDAGVSRGLLMVGISGVWNGQKDKELIPDWHLLPLEGERYSITFDSDIASNPNVQMAADRQARLLREQGAEVFVTLLPPAPDGSKQGLDDFFAAGGTVGELELLTRPYDLKTVERVRLAHDEKLRALVEDLEHRFWTTEWKGMGGASARDVALKLIEAARRYGKIHPDGLRVVKAQGPLALEAKVSSRTLWKSLNRLEEMGFAYRDNEGRKPDRSGAFVLCASVSQYGERNTHEGNVTRLLQERVPGDLHLRAPRLMWSRPKYTPKRGLVSDTRKVRQSRKLEPRDRIERPGKISGAIQEHVERAGGSIPVSELAEVMGIGRVRDFKRRALARAAGYGFVEVDDGVVTLPPDSLEARQRALRTGGEVDTHVTLPILDADGTPTGRIREHVVEGAATIARRRYTLKHRAYHRRDETPKSQPSAVGREAVRVSREKRAAHTEERRAPVDERERRIVRLIREGMSPRWARAEAMDAATVTVVVATTEPCDDPMKHPLACECLDCSARAPSYARAFGGAA